MSVSEEIWRTTVLTPNSTIEQAITRLNETGLQIVMVLDAEDKLLGIVTDGDIRRGVLKGLSLDQPIDSVMLEDSLVVPPEMHRDMVMQLMHANRYRQLPVVDLDHKVVGLHLWDEISVPVERPNVMVIMAGGRGTRLHPHTENCPKPMLHVAGKPMLEHIVERARMEGFRHFVFAIHHLGHIIEDYFGNGDKFGAQIEYLRESEPLGTAGALSLLDPHPKLPFIVTNGDVLSDVKYGELLDFHVRHSATATMAVRLHEWQQSFGVVLIEGVDVTGFEEKPIVRNHINAGIYALSPEALKTMEVNGQCNMPALFGQLQATGMRTVAYPMHEPWLDVGRPDDLKKANTENGDGN